MFNGFPFPSVLGLRRKSGCNGRKRTQREERKRQRDPPPSPPHNSGTILKRFPWGPPANGKLPLVLLATAQSSLSLDPVPPSIVWVTPSQPFEYKLVFIFDQSHRLTMRAEPVNSWDSATWPQHQNSVCPPRPKHWRRERHKTSAFPKTIETLYSLNKRLTDRHVWRRTLMDENHPTPPSGDKVTAVNMWNPCVCSLKQPVFSHSGGGDTKMIATSVRDTQVTV